MLKNEFLVVAESLYTNNFVYLIFYGSKPLFIILKINTRNLCESF
jgi:hypothetical protein